MKVLICGAGQVGYNLASYLADEGNNVTVVDQDPELIARVSDDLDVNAIEGFASNPDVLKAAKAGDCDLMIAVTRSDEVNMVACQIGHSLFGIPKKIARIREQAYLQPEWSNLFSRTHMPIDVIISPEIVVAEDIYERLSVPGATFASSLASGAVHLLGAVCNDDCPLVNTTLQQIESLFPNLTFRIMALLRAGKTIIAGPDTYIESGDEVFFVVDTQHLKRVMQAFGFDRAEARRIVIAGGGNVGAGIVRLLKERGRGEHVRLIEQNEKRAQYLSREFGDGVVILNGSSLEKNILEQASISKVDTFIAVTNDDETNILSSLLAKQYGAKRSVTLVNNSAYSPLVGPLGVDAMVSPRAIIVATVMQHIRRGRIRDIHHLRHGFAEVIEAEVSENCKIANMTPADESIPEEVRIVAIVRDGEVIMPSQQEIIRSGDHVIVLSPQEQARAVEKLFSVQVDIF
jgi:trk system potassium uptake protein TrkA